MKLQILVFILTATIISANFNYHEFTDSRGQCWRCYPDQQCERCPKWPVGWSSMCFEPNCDSQENRKFLFPSRDSDRYFQCISDRNKWHLETVGCQCGTLFNMRTQECVSVDRWSPYCSNLAKPIMITSCLTGRRISVLEHETAQQGNTTIWEPVTTTTTPMAPTTIPTTTDTIFTSTTEAGGPGVTNPGNLTSTTTVAPPSTPGSCACFPWWPCWCNPCWNMPCHNCYGCMG